MIVKSQYFVSGSISQFCNLCRQSYASNLRLSSTSVTLFHCVRKHSYIVRKSWRITNFHGNKKKGSLKKLIFQQCFCAFLVITSFRDSWQSLNCFLCLGHKSATDQILFSSIFFLMPCWHTDIAMCLEQCICNNV